MDKLPNDPAILVSSINMLLRDADAKPEAGMQDPDDFQNLEQICYCFDRDPLELQEYLEQNGYVYSEEQKQIRPIGYDKES